MRKLLSTCAIVLISTTAPAMAKQERIMIWLTSIAPVEYDKPYAGKLMIQRFSDRKKLPCSNKTTVIDAGGGTIRNPKLACAFPAPDLSWCYIAMATDQLLATDNHLYASTIRHELGHCNGWGKDHERERRIPRNSIKAPPLPKDTQYLPTDDLTSICVRANGQLKACEPEDKFSICEALSTEGKMKVCKRPAAVAANPPTTVNPPPVNSPPVKLQQTNGPQVNVQGTLFGWSIVLSGNKVCKDPFVWLDAKEITC